MIKELDRKISALGTICALSSDSIKLMYNVLRHFHGTEEWDKAAKVHEEELKNYFEMKKKIEQGNKGNTKGNSEMEKSQ